MLPLILTLIAIALTAVTMYATMSYLPVWATSVTPNYELALTGVTRLENAFTLYALANSETEAAVTGAADGGLSTNFLPYLRFLPPAPTGMAWVYGQHAVDASAYSGLHYFCLTPSGAGIDRTVFESLLRLQRSVNSAQGFLGSSCGITTASLTAPGSYPATRAFTYYVAFVPGA